MLSELLAANLCTPFLLKMVEGEFFVRTSLISGFFLSAGREKNSETEAAVGLWTGAITFNAADIRESRVGLLHHAVLDLA